MTDRAAPSSGSYGRIAAYAAGGAVVGLLLGLVLAALFDGEWVDNPFWAMAAGIFAGAVFGGTKRG